MNDYDSLYSGLNTQQKLAVDSVEGCVMVVAGPGTGKTQVLGARVANILNVTDSYPENILCLTFTEAAATALRNRLYSFIGAASHRVNIQTYHGFSNQVIQENKDLFGLHDLSPVSELEEIEVMKEIIDDLPNDHILKRFRGEVYYDAKDLRKLFSLMKREGLNGAKIEHLVSERLEALKQDESMYYKRNSGEFKKGDLKINQYKPIEKRLQKLVAASQLITAYDQKLIERKRYDFDDMLAWVLNVFDQYPEVLQRYQEQFHYFLVDEYQDTNGVQNQLLFKLIEYWDNPNVFVVGDDDQSIYKFQGANVENIFNFYAHYKQYANLVVLDQNYRSSQNILDGSNGIIQRNNERLVGKVEGITKDIKAANPSVADIANAVRIVEYPNLYQEVVSITSRIKELAKRGVPLSEVAILYRNHAQSEALIRFLESERIVYNVVRTTNVLDEVMVAQLNDFLTYLALESKSLDSGSHLLFKMLYSNSFENISAFDIARMSRALNKERKSGGWRSLLNDEEFINALGLSTKAKAELKRFVSDTEYWIKERHNVTLQVLVEKVLSKMGFISRALTDADATYKVQCLKTYFNFLKEETARNPSLTLDEFLHKIELLKRNKLGLNLNKVVHGESGVNLMTVHGSKGLEFDHVFLMGCIEKKWEKDRNPLPFGLNEILPGSPKHALEEESRRLFYVALTRARKSMEVSYAIKDDKDKDLAKSVFVVELEETGAAKTESVRAEEKEMLNFFEHMVTHHDEGYRNLVEQDFVREAVREFRMNTTNLNAYLKCPVSFFYQHIVRVPSAKNETMTFGSAMHYAMEGLFSDDMKANGLEKTQRMLVSRFTTYINNNKESFTPEALERRLHYGKQLLTDYAVEHWEMWVDQEHVETEVYFNNGEIDGVPIGGVIDKIIVDKGSAHVVDYKTGNPENGRKKIKPPETLDGTYTGDDFNKKYGGDYWRQIMFYKALIESDQRMRREVVSGSLEFLEQDQEKWVTGKVVVKAEEYDFARRQIVDTYQRIQGLEFTEGCNEEDCEWCNFNKHYAGNLRYTGENLLNERSMEIGER